MYPRTWCPVLSLWWESKPLTGMPVASGSLVLFWPWEPPRLGPLSCFGCSGLAVVIRLYGLRASVLLGAADGLYMHSFHYPLVDSILKQKPFYIFLRLSFSFLSIFTFAQSDRLQFKRSTQSTVSSE